MNSKKFNLLFDIRQNLVLAVEPKDPETELNLDSISVWVEKNMEVLRHFAASSANSLEVDGIRTEKRRIGVEGEHNVSALCGPFLMTTGD